MTRKQIILIYFITLTCLSSYGQMDNPCSIKGLKDLEKAKLKTFDFAPIDTIVKGKSYNVFNTCSDGTTIFGNIKKNGKKNGAWLFILPSTASFSGKYKNDKMSGIWHEAHMTLKYVRGKRKTKTIPF